MDGCCYRLHRNCYQIHLVFNVAAAASSAVCWVKSGEGLFHIMIKTFISLVILSNFKTVFNVALM